MADEHERTGHMRAVQQDVEIRGHTDAVLRQGRRIAPASARPIVDAHPRVACDGRSNPSPIPARLAQA
jgi:hypothetical protein